MRVKSRAVEMCISAVSTWMGITDFYCERIAVLRKFLEATCGMVKKNVAKEHIHEQSSNITQRGQKKQLEGGGFTRSQISRSDSFCSNLANPHVFKHKTS